MAVNPDKLNAFMSMAVGDIGAAMSANMVLLGDKLGLYKAMVKAGPATPAELAKATKTNERYVREWLGNQAAGGYVTYDARTGRYTLPEEQARHSPMKAVLVSSLARFRSSRPHFQPTPRSSSGSRTARASGGISTITDCLKARRDSSVRTTWATSWRIGFRPSTGWRQSSREVRKSQMSAAGLGRPPSSCRRPIPHPPSSASITISPRS